MTQTTTLSKILFWAVAVIALLWNAMGCINFAQQMAEGGRATLPPEYQTFIETRPFFALIGFAVSVFAGVIGAVLLMMRNKQAVAFFIVSCIGAIVTTIPTIASGMMSIIVGSAMSVVLAALFALYAARALR